MDAETLGFIELTTVEGSSIWIVAGSIWAVEKGVNEAFTMVKTASEPVGVMEPPRIIFERMLEVMQAVPGA